MKADPMNNLLLKLQLERQRFEKEAKMGKVKSQIQVDVSTIVFLIGIALIALVVASNALWIIGGAALAWFLWAKVVAPSKGNGLFALPIRVGEVEEKQDDMATVLGLKWFKIPEQRFYHKKKFNPKKYNAKKMRNKEMKNWSIVRES